VLMRSREEPAMTARGQLQADDGVGRRRGVLAERL